MSRQKCQQLVHFGPNIGVSLPMFTGTLVDHLRQNCIDQAGHTLTLVHMCSRAMTYRSYPPEQTYMYVVLCRSHWENMCKTY